MSIKNQNMMSNISPQTATIRIQGNILPMVKLFLNGESWPNPGKRTEMTLELTPGEYELCGVDRSRSSEKLMLNVQGGEVYELQFSTPTLPFSVYMGLVITPLLGLLTLMLLPYGILHLLPGTTGLQGAILLTVILAPLFLSVWFREQKWGKQIIQLKVSSGPVGSYILHPSPDFYKRSSKLSYVGYLLALASVIMVLVDYPSEPFTQWIRDTFIHKKH